MKCFATLLESIPGWIAELEEILRTGAERQKQILFDNQPVNDDHVIDNRPKKPSKASSVRSRRSHNARPDIPTATDIEPTLTRTQLPHMTPSDALRLAQRKRKTASACSDDEQLPYKYRSRSMAVIYYDGETQKRFEEMVKKIGSSRNFLRKGKIQARSDILSGRDPHTDDGNDSDGSSFMPKIAFRSARTRGQPVKENNDGTEAFDRIDTFLDKAQSMCERAAHQVLRDGDCALEIKHATEHFNEARKLGSKELPIWEQRSEDAAERAKKKAKQERGRETVEMHTGPGAASSSEETLLVKQQSTSTPGLLEVDIEVDDSDGTDDEPVPLDLKQLRQEYSKKSCLRSAGLTAR